jgi:hypothetical protein
MKEKQKNNMTIVINLGDGNYVGCENIPLRIRIHVCLEDLKAKAVGSIDALLEASVLVILQTYLYDCQMRVLTIFLVS